MAKKEYIIPTIKELKLPEQSHLLAVSHQINSNEGITGGDKDEDGSMDPDAKQDNFDEDSDSLDVWNWGI